MNVYCHFPFCRRKCAYCALHSRAGASPSVRAEYSRRLAAEVLKRVEGSVSTLYFGGGTPAMCNLEAVAAAFQEKGFVPDYEFTVELNPADVFEYPGILERLAAAGVNRLSMGFEALDDETLSALARTHSMAMAQEAFRRAQAVFPNCGFDLIAGLPPMGRSPQKSADMLSRVLEELSPDHVSVYSLIREPGTELDKKLAQGLLTVPDDEAAMDEVAALASTLAAFGLKRYEISNYARPLAECCHNLAVWRGEDYLGLGEGAHGREGLVRTVGKRCAPNAERAGEVSAGATWTYSRQTLSVQADAQERELFSLRTRLGFNPESAVRRHPVLAPQLDAWRRELDFNVREGLLDFSSGTYTLTPRGYEVCDAIIERLIA